ncbi:MAG TPA: alpha-amylase/4-alpha-glucanotransferase domain-containing protein, partial [Candidatus Acidoferrales bacterium]|nr:alpha-amylase/4-alpha-glucanotransferase domain-containing protein [Candidatus Acidoferrales bacterium]
MNRIHLILLIHAHQPVGNFDHVFEHVYQQSYLPFLDCLERHPRVRVGLHYSGPLLEWLDARHPDYLDRVARAAESGQVEIVGGGFYEPILISIPRHDQIEQISRMREWLAKRIGKSPSGAWLAERVWEPQLPDALHAAGVEYTLLDDVHFLSAGFQPDQLHGYYFAEEQGKTVKVLPGLKAMRYMVPFRQVEETIGFLRGAADQTPGGMVAMGDDMEKFGGWPGTHDHCYRDGWLDRFFAAVEENGNWMLPTPPVEYTESHPPSGRADLPAASYTEMMEWVLPTGARKKLHEIEGEFVSREDVQRFLRGGVWRGFMSKYDEVNLLHKKALHVSRELTAKQKKKTGTKGTELSARARTHLLRAQCNDAYWHGVFGGLYSPHLRTE